MAVVQHLILLGLCLSFSLWASQPSHIRYSQGLAPERYEGELLQRAIELTANEYGPALVKSVPPLARKEMALAKDLVDVAYMSSSLQRERNLLPIKVPLLQGMLGYRLLFTTPTGSARLSAANHIEPFIRQFIGGSLLYWVDFTVLNHNRLLVKTSVRKDELFEMLMRGEIDYLARGVNEAFWEFDLYSESYPDLTINPDVAIYYPFAVYFYVRGDRALLAKRIAKGLALAQQDGSFYEIFQRHFKGVIERVRQIKPSKLVYLENPHLKLDTSMQLHWWLDDPAPIERAAESAKPLFVVTSD